MKFWEAMKELEEGKIVLREGGLEYRIFNDVLQYRTNYDWHNSNHEWQTSESKVSLLVMSDWEIAEEKEEPPFYWQWTYEKGNSIIDLIPTLMTEDQCFNNFYKNVKKEKLNKLAGPWVKKKNGLKKHSTWEQF